MANEKKKAYRVPASPISYVKMAGAIATDRITVDGQPVGYMRRAVPIRPEDSGWAFYAGDETERYVADPSNASVWHVNDIANMDPSIVPWLYALPGAVFERDRASGGFVEAPESKPDASMAALPDGVTVVQGHVVLGEGWSASLPTPFRRRIEDGSLVLWRPGLTFWFALGAANETPMMPHDAKNGEQWQGDDGVKRLVFERTPEREGASPVVVGYIDHAQRRAFVHAYYDRAPDGDVVRAILGGIRPA